VLGWGAPRRGPQSVEFECVRRWRSAPGSRRLPAAPTGGLRVIVSVKLTGVIRSLQGWATPGRPLLVTTALLLEAVVHGVGPSAATGNAHLNGYQVLLPGRGWRTPARLVGTRPVAGMVLGVPWKYTACGAGVPSVDPGHGLHRARRSRWALMIRNLYVPRRSCQPVRLESPGKDRLTSDAPGWLVASEAQSCALSAKTARRSSSKVMTVPGRLDRNEVPLAMRKNPGQDLFSRSTVEEEWEW
jgi:hypothetical protein